MNTHTIGVVMVIVSIIIGIMMLPARQSITSATIVNPDETHTTEEQPEQASYIGKECTTRKFFYTTQASSAADCSSKEHPFPCIAQCTLKINNKEEKTGNYSFEAVFTWKGEKTSQTVKKEISPSGNAQFRYTFQYRTDDIQKVPTCSFRPVAIPEETTCIDIVRTRKLA